MILNDLVFFSFQSCLNSAFTFDFIIETVGNLI